MKRYETLETLLSKVDLSFAETVLNESYHEIGSRGRPPRKPLGVFKAYLLRRLRHVPSDRMLVRQLWKDPRLRRLCDIEACERPYGIAVLSRFKMKVGSERLMRIVDHAVKVLVKKGRIMEATSAADFKACCLTQTGSMTPFSSMLVTSPEKTSTPIVYPFFFW
jgi:hypothetical protein